MDPLRARAVDDRPTEVPATCEKEDQNPASVITRLDENWTVYNRTLSTTLGLQEISVHVIKVIPFFSTK